MLTVFAILSASFLLCCVLVPVARSLAIGWGLVDNPDAARKLHRLPTPVAGGLAVFLSCVVVLAAAFLLPNPVESYLLADSFYLVGLLLASAFICAVGVVDDFRCLRGRHKLLGQVIAVCIVMAFGVRVDRIEAFGWALELGVWAMPFTLLWLLGAINSLNLIDGIDGMLGCVGVIICLALAGMAALGGHWAAACVAGALAGSLLGFLCYNLPPAKIFMGDAGSMTVGLAVGVLGIQTSLKAPTTAALIAPLVILTIPFLDTAAAIVRRKLTGRSIYDTDRGHLHHCLIQRGFSPRMVLAVVSFFCLVAVISALGSLAFKNEAIAVCGALTVVATLVTTKLFGYKESLLIKNRAWQLALSVFQSRGEGKSRRIDLHMQGNASWSKLLDTVSTRAIDLNLQSVGLDVRAPVIHEEYHGHWERFDAEVKDVLWRVELPLEVGGRDAARLLITGRVDSEQIWSKLAAITELIEEFVLDELDGVVLSGSQVPAGLDMPRARARDPMRLNELRRPTREYQLEDSGEMSLT
jgi:UDP-GlcNAc:undecaprenyl-phosphate GlcNAc-1-phosphate transferase